MRTLDRIAFFGLVVFAFFSGSADPQAFGQATGPARGPFLVWDAMNKDYAAKTGETTNLFIFNATNVSTRPVYIEKLTPSCGCTVATLPAQPWLLAPGSNGAVRITINFAGKVGLVTKFIRVDAFEKESPDATTSNKFEQTLIIKVNIPAGTNPPALTTGAPNPAAGMNRAKNAEMAKADRQAVFKGDCASCHAVPAHGKSGEELFRAACAICHESSHRATMVPDLATLKTKADDVYWRSWICFGKEGTLMPGFLDSAPAGGPLTPEQVSSLVNYLRSKYPARVATAQAGGAQKN
jgi:mono/diheme cytochrome c family protein